MLCNFFWKLTPSDFAKVLLRQSFLMAHKSNCLMLLPSRPDMVHSLLLHKTLTSTQNFCLLLKVLPPRKVFCLATADCKFRAPLTPHIAQQYYITSNKKKFQVFYHFSFNQNLVLKQLCNFACSTFAFCVLFYLLHTIFTKLS